MKKNRVLGRKLQIWLLEGGEYKQDLMNLNETSHMAKHLINEHNELNITAKENRIAERWFKMEMVSQHTKTLERQLSEVLEGWRG